VEQIKIENKKEAHSATHDCFVDELDTEMSVTPESIKFCFLHHRGISTEAEP